MAATLLFSLPGLPMLYNGQEIGFKKFPSKTAPIFKRDSTIRSLNTALFDFYKHLISVRKQNDALVSGTLREIKINNAPGAVAFLRSNAHQDIVVIINMAGNANNIQLEPGDLLNRPGNKISFTDLLSGETIAATVTDGKTVAVTIDAYTTKLLLLNKNVVNRGYK